jgi:radical SAM superfamily enzyme YgiQ (UPF0313 family)
MRVLLVGPGFEDNLSLRYLSSSLTAAGHDPHLAEFDDPSDLPAVVSAAQGADLVGLSMSFQVRAREFLELARVLKDAGVPRVIAGGHFATCAAEDLLANNPAIDLVVLHEGERSLVEIADCGADPAGLERIPGLVLRSEGELVRTGRRHILGDLDALPFPDRSGPIHLFACVPTAYVLGSRGCVARCDYCCIATLHRTTSGKRFRQRAPERVAEEMADLYHNRGIRQFIFHDDNFLVPSIRRNHARLDRLERALRERSVRDIGLVIKCRPHDAERSVFHRLRDMGLLRVFLGVESSSAAGLVSIGRRQTAAESEAALALCTELGISAQYTIMCFHPDATLQTVRDDLAFMRRHLHHALNFCRTEIYAGTPLLQRMQTAGRARGDYLAHTYTIADPRVQLACTAALRIFKQRCWAMRGLMERVIGLDHLSAVAGRFYGQRATRSVRAEIARWRDDANRALVDLLEEVVERCAAAGVPSAALEADLLDLAYRERLGRLLLLERGAALHRQLDDLVLARVGLVRQDTLRPVARAPLRQLARHAAAVLLALGTTGATACIGVSEYAPPPLEDTDSDGLPDECETTIFGTDPSDPDSDDDGTRDGDEDHDDDGLTNQQEQDEAGPYECRDISPPGDSGDTG